MHPIETIGVRYPQVCFDIAPTTRDTEVYRDAVLRGRRDGLSPRGFTLSAEDRLMSVMTPVGAADVLFLCERADFERAVQALAYRCEPRPIPPSMGATTIRGLINWEKIDRRKEAYLASGGRDWAGEFRRFTAVPGNYRDSLILVSRGCYSAVPPDKVGLSEAAWLEKSQTIRIYHELTHFIFRSKYPDDVDAIRDEVIADAVGLAAAYGAYSPELAKLFLGVEGAQYRRGGRLENYLVDRSSSQDPIAEAVRWIDRMEETLGGLSAPQPFEAVEAVEKKLHLFQKPCNVQSNGVYKGIETVSRSSQGATD